MSQKYSGKVVVTGAGGQLGQDLLAQLEACGYETVGYTRTQLDVTVYEEVDRIIMADSPDIIIHTAAYTKVDQAETEQDEAYRINAYGTRNVAVAGQKVGAKLVYLSTDYVFDGEGTHEYDEFHRVSPINVYGKSKLAGEQFVSQFHSRYFIVRTSWVYGENGINFVKTMLKLASEGKPLQVVDDQIGCPTYSVDLAQSIAELIITEKYGIYHISNSGSCSWYEFAQAIFEQAQITIELNPTSSGQIKRAAKRPAYSVFRHLALEANGFHPMRTWRAALAEFIPKLFEST
ncbi:dTDP-4-dehydrorhamnose reductase [Paenibacillaceae bacterium]|nr:dTDP-4-dehydrorhamnose reductase [Paenibacillaceae bacterium]